MKRHENEFVRCLGEVRLVRWPGSLTDRTRQQQLWQVTDANGYRQEWRDVPVVDEDRP